MYTLPEAIPVLDRQTETQLDLVAGTQAAEINGAGALEARRADLIVVEGLGDTALTLADESADTDTGLTDGHGNLLQPQMTDAREVDTYSPWALEGPSIRRFLSLDLPTAIVKAYRTIPPEARGKVVRGSSSQYALGALAAGYGLKQGFWAYALPKGFKGVLNPAQPGPWEGALDW